MAKEKGGHGDMDVDAEATSGFDTRKYTNKATDFELPDYWDEGEVLDGRDKWPVCVTLNLVRVLVSVGDLRSMLMGCYSCHRYII